MESQVMQNKPEISDILQYQKQGKTGDLIFTPTLDNKYRVNIGTSKPIMRDNISMQTYLNTTNQFFSKDNAYLVLLDPFERLRVSRLIQIGKDNQSPNKPIVEFDGKFYGFMNVLSSQTGQGVPVCFFQHDGENFGYRLDNKVNTLPVNEILHSKHPIIKGTGQGVLFKESITSKDDLERRIFASASQAQELIKTLPHTKNGQDVIYDVDGIVVNY